MKSKPFLLVFLSVLLSNISLKSQSYFEYKYDDSGNRTQRKVIIVAAPPQAAAVVVPDTVRQEEIASIPAQDSTPSFKTEDTLVKVTSSALLNADIYPNPTYGIVNVIIAEQGSFTGVLYNMEGKAVMHQVLISGQNLIDLSNLLDGQFILRITSAEGRTQEFKIIKKS